MKKISAESLEGLQIDNYLIKHKIGVGGMGVVYLAYDDSLQRNVCIKVLKDKYKDDEIVVERFTREAINIAKLNDLHIINIYKIATYKDIKYFVMEYVDGTSLDKYLKDRGKLNWKESLKITGSVLEALICAHSFKIIHRDIKPSNILINKKGIVKVTDFGLARYIQNIELGLTEPGTILGTPYYMSPEQWMGEPIGEACDLYSLGITLVELLIGEVPYKINNYNELIKATDINNLNLKIKTICKDIPDDVLCIIETLLYFDPKARGDAKTIYTYIKNILEENSEEINNPSILDEKNIVEPLNKKFKTQKKEESVIYLYLDNEKSIVKKILIGLTLLCFFFIIIYASLFIIF